MFSKWVKNEQRNKKWHRLAVGAVFFLLMGGCLFFMFLAFEKSIIFFYTPQQFKQALHANPVPTQKMRLGGVVQKGSFFVTADEKTFILKDEMAQIKVKFKGVLPDLFREGQGVVAEGVWNPKESLFQAHTLLTKHDEVYIPRTCNPPENKKQDTWQSTSR